MKIIVWLKSLQVPLLNASLNVLTRTYGQLEYVGVLLPDQTAGQGRAVSFNAQTIPVLAHDSIGSLEYDIVLVTGGKFEFISMPEVLKDAKRLGLDVEKIVLDRTVCVPGFTLDKYRLLKRSYPSIISQNCCGADMYHLFGLQFTSPTITLFFHEDDFMKLIRNPRQYFDYELRLLRFVPGGYNGSDYPIFLLGDVKVRMNHYYDVNEAREKWEERRLKINWYNLMVMGYTDKPEILEEFDLLPFAKKVCFTTFETDLPSGFYIPRQNYAAHEKISDAANHFSRNDIRLYDIWDILLYGKKTPLK